MDKVFVYGSLKQGFGNHRLLENSKFLETTKTANPTFEMFSFGPFPGVVDGHKQIEGEMYEVDEATLANLDRLESNGSFYQRFEYKFENGETAWLYKTLHYDNDDVHNKSGVTTEERVQRWTNE